MSMRKHEEQHLELTIVCIYGIYNKNNVMRSLVTASNLFWKLFPYSAFPLPSRLGRMADEGQPETVSYRR
jgi:hypothetical protein